MRLLLSLSFYFFPASFSPPHPRSLSLNPSFSLLPSKETNNVMMTEEKKGLKILLSYDCNSQQHREVGESYLLILNNTKPAADVYKNRPYAGYLTRAAVRWHVYSDLPGLEADKLFDSPPLLTLLHNDRRCPNEQHPVFFSLNLSHQLTMRSTKHWNHRTKKVLLQPRDRAGRTSDIVSTGSEWTRVLVSYIILLHWML